MTSKKTSKSQAFAAQSLTGEKIKLHFHYLHFKVTHSLLEDIRDIQRDEQL